MQPGLALPARIAAAGLLVAAVPGHSQGVDAGTERLKALLDTPVISATQHPMPMRESPGILTVLDREDILTSGASDLLGLLRMVPGIDFGSDTNGVIGIGIRGNWGHDGKVLLLVDGQEMNEPLYGTLQFGGHIPIADLERLEIIRGPGSIIYGGFAELAVINLITRRGREIDGVTGDLWLGRMAGADPLSRQGHVGFGKAWGDHEVSLSYSRADLPSGVGSWPTSSGIREAGTYGLFHQDFLNLGYSFQKLNLRYIRDRYYLDDYTAEFKPGVAALKFPGDYFGLDWEWTKGAWTVKPRFTIKHQSPWNYTDSRTDRNTRAMASLSVTWQASEDLKLSLTGEATQDNANIFWSSKGYRQLYIYENRAVGAQALWSTDFGNLDLGVRSDHNNQFGSATSPRLAFTKAVENWHIKLLAAGAFRAPSIENLFVNPGLRPERTRSFEAELGHDVTAHTYLSANAFFERIQDPISYANPAPGVNTYLNFDHVGSRGLELTLRGQHTTVSYQSSFTYQQADDRQADFYRVAGQDAFHVGFPRMKFTLQPQIKFAPGWSFNPSLLVLGERYGYRYRETQPSRFGTTAVIDLYLTRQLSENFLVALKLANLTATETPLIQPYGFPGTGGNPPLPGSGREVDLRLAFHF